MRNIWTIAKREYDHYFISPIAYVVAFMILLTIGIIFAINISIIWSDAGYVCTNRGLCISAGVICARSHYETDLRRGTYGNAGIAPYRSPARL